MFGNSISILYSALLADQKALQIRNRNIANVNNPDYVAENPYLETLPGVGGVVVSDVRRAAEEVLHHQLLDSNSRYSGFEEAKKLLEDLEPYFSETGSGGLQEYTDRFFQSLHDFLREPTNIAAQNALHSSAERLAETVRGRYELLKTAEGGILDKFEDSLKQVNRIAAELGKLNREIARAYAQNYSEGKDYKYLLDQRDKLLRELSRFAGITYKTDKIGRVEVVIGEPPSTAAGFIRLVGYGGEVNELELVKNNTNPLQSKVVDKNGIQWEVSFFKRGLLGGYVSALETYEGLVNRLDTFAGNLINNLSLAGLGNKNLFKGTGASDLAVNFTAAELAGYDKTQAENDADSADRVWNTAKADLESLNSYFADRLTDTTIRFETERDLYQSLKDKYSQRVGVNLDEELAEVMRLQQHYQAIGKMIATSTRLLDYLLNSIR